MADADTSQSDRGATAERSVGFGVALFLCVAAAVVLAAGASWRCAGTPRLSEGEKINPNTAPASSLARLPRIGWSKAQAIVGYRQERWAATGTTAVFRNPSDLTQVPGIGPKTAEAISAWLDFGPTGAEPETCLPTPPADR